MTLPELVIPVVWAGASHLSMWTAGSWCRSFLFRKASADGDAATRAFQSVLLGFALLGTGAFVLGAAGLLYRPLLALILGVLSAAGTVRLWRSRPFTFRRPVAGDLPMIATALFIFAHLPRALCPVMEHDENVYHLLLPKLYLAGHALTPLPWSLGANMPHLVDLSFVFPAAYGGFTAAKVFVLGFLGWTLVGLAPFGREMLGPMGPGVLAVLFLSSRIIQWHLGLAYVEPVIGALMLGALQALRRYWSDGEKTVLPVLGLLTGAACASKYTAWPQTMVMFGLAAAVRSQGGRRLRPRELALMMGLAALLVLPWLGKNVAVTGNPVFPNANGAFGGHYWSQIQVVQFQHEMGYGRGADPSVATYLRLPYQLVVEPYTGMLGGASFSATLVLLLVVSLGFPWRASDFRTVLRLLTVAAFVFWCLGSKQGRYLVAFVPIMIVTAGIALAPLRRWAGGLAAATMVIATVAVAQIRWQPYPAEPLLDTFRVSRTELLGRNLCWDLAGYLNGLVPEGGGVVSFWENRLYFLDRPFITDSAYGAPTILARLRDAGDPHAFATQLAAEGFTHVVVNPYFYKAYMGNGFLYNMIDEQDYPAERLAADNALFLRFAEEELEEIPWAGGWAVFRLKAANAGAGR